MRAIERARDSGSSHFFLFLHGAHEFDAYGHTACQPFRCAFSALCCSFSLLCLYACCWLAGWQVSFVVFFFVFCRVSGTMPARLVVYTCAGGSTHTRGSRTLDTLRQQSIM